MLAANDVRFFFQQHFIFLLAFEPDFLKLATAACKSCSFCSSRLCKLAVSRRAQTGQLIVGRASSMRNVNGVAVASDVQEMLVQRIFLGCRARVLGGGGVHVGSLVCQTRHISYSPSSTPLVMGELNGRAALGSRPIREELPSKHSSQNQDAKKAISN